jgi:hypothetical protein
MGYITSNNGMTVYDQLKIVWKKAAIVPLPNYYAMKVYKRREGKAPRILNPSVE